MDLEETVKHIGNLIEKTRQGIADVMPIIRGDIAFIINNQIDSIENIERILDTLLDYISFNCGTEEFKKLNVYYAAINKENSEIYAKFYDEAVDSQ